jgi:glutathione S-transferase/GST-like protein
MGEPKLYHWEPNANSGKPILALEEKGVEYESVYVNMHEFDQHQAWYLEINPAGVVPAMSHDGQLLVESTAIMEYVDERFDGPPLRPAVPFQRWKMRWWMKFLDQYYGPSVSMLAWEKFVGPAMRARDPAEMKARLDAIPLPERRAAWTKTIYGQFTPEELAESRRRVMYSAELFERNLEGGDWLAGDEFSLADINAFNTVYLMPQLAETLELPAVGPERTPRTLRWLKRMYLRPSVRRAWARSRGGMQIDIDAELGRLPD